MTFIDLFSGIGGFRSGFEKAGMECLGFVEYDKFARKSYEAMYETTNEWTAHDIRLVQPGDIPKADLWCFGFPCQDISVAGRSQGLSGSRSGLFYTVIDLLNGLEDACKPKWIVVENVKNLLSINGGWDFAAVLSEISEAGYDAEWALLNSKDFGVPQNRERVFIVGHLRGRGGQFILSDTGKNRYYTSGKQKEMQLIFRGKNQFDRLFKTNGISATIPTQSDGAGFYVIPKINKVVDSTQHFSVVGDNGLAPTVAACDYKDPQKVAIPCLRPDKEKKQLSTLATKDKQGILVYNGNQYYVRRLTPKECFRLQGFTDEQFEKAAAVNSNTQLYKQAGNAVTVNVAEWIGKRIVESER